MVAAVTASGASIAGCNSWPLGRMRYVAAASPGFIARHFAQGVSAAALARQDDPSGCLELLLMFRQQR